MALMHWRKRKRLMNWYMKKLSHGKYFVDCRYHPCSVSAYWIRSEDPYGSDVDGISLINGTPSSCSCMHCGPEPVTKELAEEMAEFARNNPWNDYLMKYHGFTPEAIAYHDELDKVWNFEKANLDTSSSGATVSE